MSFLFKWLRTRPRERLILHPTRRLEVAAPVEAAFAKCVAGIENVLGGIVREADVSHGSIEAAFGLIDSERLTCTLQSINPDRTSVIIESRRGPRLSAEGGSPYVNALAAYLESLSN